MFDLFEAARSTTLPISKGGQISLPAKIRQRWRVARLMFIDHGDWAELRPLPENPVAAARGILRREGATPSEELRARERRREAEKIVHMVARDDRRGSFNDLP